MADWQNLTEDQQSKLKELLKARLEERGLDCNSIDLEEAGLAGRYRLYVVSGDFAKLDYADRLKLLSDSIAAAWPRADQLRITLQFPLSPDEVPSPTNN